MIASVKLAVLGGGGFRVPLVYGALSRAGLAGDVVLHDVSPERLAAIAHVIGPGVGTVTTTTSLDEALDGADTVFCAIRVGGLEGRLADERVALEHGLLGQETTGPGGIAYGLRTVPVATAIAARIAALAPHAWVVNFTNPAGMITEAMQRVLGPRVVGICDSPLGLVRRATAAAGAPPGTIPDYVGINHLGWLRGLWHSGRDLLPALLDSGDLERVEEARVLGPDWVRTLGVLPNEYLYYYYFTREAIAATRRETRGEALLGQQSRFYDAALADPAGARAAWERTRRERDESYMAEARSQARDLADLEAGGYEGIAVELLAALGSATPVTMILNVANGTAVPGLPAEAVVEVPCAVSSGGIVPLATRPLEGAFLGLLQQVKAVEQAAVEAALTGSSRLAAAALAQHPLVDSAGTARQLLDGYRARIPSLDAVFTS